MAREAVTPVPYVTIRLLFSSIKRAREGSAAFL
jgi:hypothetical protein